jgi:hypothetical protein
VLSANDRVGLGVIGLGRRGTIVCDTLLGDGRMRLAPVSDVYDAQIDRFVARYADRETKPPPFLSTRIRSGTRMLMPF